MTSDAGLPPWFLEASFLQGLSSVLWPIGIFALALIYRRAILRLLDRIIKAKVANVEFELETQNLSRVVSKIELKVSRDGSIRRANEGQVQETTSRAEEDVPIIEFPEYKPAVGSNIWLWSSWIRNRVRYIRDVSVREPAAAVVMLSAELERAFSGLVAFLDRDSKTENNSNNIDEQISRLSGVLRVTDEFRASVMIFARLRNIVIHNREDVDSSALRDVIEMGIKILESIEYLLQQIPNVLRADIELYSDQGGFNRIEKLIGLFVIYPAVPGSTGHGELVPTNRLNYYRTGDLVKLGFDEATKIGRTWYRDWSSGQIEHGWYEAKIFVGDRLQDVSSR